ncbi:MAG: radical SAM protein [Planctomycetota bacterium]
MYQTDTDRSRLIDRTIGEAFEGRPVSDPEDIGALFEIPAFTEESARLIAAGRKLSGIACDGKAEVHAQTSVNVAPCPLNCAFCAFARQNEVFTESKEFSIDYLVEKCRQFESDGANAVLLMATGDYPFDRFVEVGAEVGEQLRDETVFVANVGDFDAEQGRRLREAGFTGIYHAVRLGEGRDTTIPVQRRFQTFRAAKEAGLALGTCLEPVGPEHSTEELVEKLLITRDVEPAYSGAARRIPIPGTRLAAHGMLSEARMAHVLAVTRLALPLDIKGNCTHEPNTLGAAAGANLMWAEAGGNPRDTEEQTEESRGKTVADIREVYGEAEWEFLDGPSVFYGA